VSVSTHKVKVDIALYLHTPYDTHLHRVHPNPLLRFNYIVCVFEWWSTSRTITEKVCQWEGE